MQEYHSKAKRGIKLLMGRQVLVQCFTFAGGVILARTLRPEEFGLYAIAMFLVSTFALIGDFGLAPSFIQRKAELTEHDLHVGFTLQQILTTAIFILLLVFSPWLAKLYPKAPPNTVWLVRALAVTLYLTSWRSMSALQLERHLNYSRLARIEVVEIVTFQLIAVAMALMGAGTWSYVVASLTQGLLGTSLMYAAAPWKVRLAFDYAKVRELIRFGVPFQLQIILNSFGAWANPVVVGSVVGPAGVGYITWAASNGRKPLFLVDSIMRVAFPHFSRIQNDAAEVERTVTRYLNWTLPAAGLWFTVLASAATPIVELIYKSRWVAGVPALVLYSACLFVDIPVWIVGITLNGIGKIKITTACVTVRSIVSLGLTIALVFTLNRSYSYNGVPLAYFIANLVIVLPLLRALGPGVTGRILRSTAWVLAPIAGGLTCGLVLSAVTRGHAMPLLLRVFAIALPACLAYAGCAVAAMPGWMRGMLHARLNAMRPGSRKPLPARSS